MPIQINIICPMATPRTTDRTETSKKAFMRESKTLEKEIKKEEVERTGGERGMESLQS